MTAATWTTREGLTVPIGEMTDQHLRNTIRYLRRNAQRLADRPIRIVYVEEGFLGFDMTDSKLVPQPGELTPAEYLREHTPYEAMLRHAKRRGLNIEPWEEDDE